MPHFIYRRLLASSNRDAVGATGCDEEGVMKATTTYSSWSIFRNCRKMYQLKYIKKITPLKKEPALQFGSVMHRALELWHSSNIDCLPVFNYLNEEFSNRTHDPAQNKMWHLATAMFTGYSQRYVKEPFEIIELERKFQQPIVNPATGAKSPKYNIEGKVDGVIKLDGGYYLLEHKTASQIDGNYLDKLWTDFQITIYSKYIAQELGILISGVLYNILCKARLQQYEVGKTRKVPESDADFQARLVEKYSDPTMFHREIIFLDATRLKMIEVEIWELTQALNDATRRDAWYQNTSYCFNWHRPCSYLPLCSSNENPNILNTMYEIAPPFEELAEDQKPF